MEINSVSSIKKTLFGNRPIHEFSHEDVLSLSVHSENHNLHSVFLKRLPVFEHEQLQRKEDEHVDLERLMIGENF